MPKDFEMSGDVSADEEAKAAEEARLAKQWDEADPALKAEFEQQYAETRAVNFDHWLKWREEYRRADPIKASVGQADAHLLAKLSNKTRERLLLDGKSLP